MNNIFKPRQIFLIISLISMLVSYLIIDRLIWSSNQKVPKIEDIKTSVNTKITTNLAKSKTNIQTNTTKVQIPNIYITLKLVDIHREPSSKSERVTQALHGEPVNILQQQDNWVEISLPHQFDYRGWVKTSALKQVNTAADWLNLKIVNESNVEVFNLPKKDSSILETLSLGMVVSSQLSESNGEFTLIKLVNGRTGYIVTKKLQNFSQENVNNVSSQQILTTAKKLLGRPYLWGGMTTKGVDCSGFIHTVFKVNGIKLHRDADLQYLYDGKKVAPTELQVGDLVFFETYKSGPSHIGIYLGNRKFIQAASSEGVSYGSLDSEYYSKRFLGAKRILTSKLKDEK